MGEVSKREAMGIVPADQMESYIRMFDALQKRDDDNPTIGLIPCSEKNEAIARYSSLADGKQLFASKYVFELPLIEELQAQMESTRREFEHGAIPEEENGMGE